jgi:hypothetical protein
MGWKKAAAQLGTGAMVSALRALEPQLKKRDYKRLVATTVAQLLALYPGLGPRKARHRAQRATGTRPSKKAMLAMAKIGLKETAEAAAAAALTAGATKVVGKLANRAKERLAGSHGRAPEGARSTAG